MVAVITLLKWTSYFSFSLLQRPFLPVFKDVLLYVSMSCAMWFLISIVLAYGFADPHVQQYLTKTSRAVVEEGGVQVTSNEVRIAFSYESFVSASMTMTVVATMAVLLCVSFVLQMAFDGMVTCVAPMVACTVNTVKPKCWNVAKDFRGKVPSLPTGSEA